MSTKAAEVLRQLRREYGPVNRGPALHPTDSLIATILSQHTADRNSSAAFAALQDRYTSWQDVADAPTEELAVVIRPAGLANIKARRIQQCLHALYQQHGTMDLEFLLHDRSVKDGLAMLASLPGVGPKTAACVLLFACDLPVLPVDTHVHRVARRLGLIGPKVSAEQAHLLLADIVAPDDVLDFHVDLIRHGRRICRAQHPRCAECVLQGLCDYANGGEVA